MEGRQANMSPGYISFSKTFHKYIISGPFQLNIPKEFSNAHLPRHDSAVILVDESGREYTVMFLLKSSRFICGWRDFVVAHGLVEGDTADFHLIDECKFKVHISRATRSIENEFQNNKPVDTGSNQEVGIRKTVDADNFSVEQLQVMQANMSPQCISFSKKLYKYHLSPEFCLILPLKFCDSHLPCHNDTIILLSESEPEYSVRYMVNIYSNRHKLTIGWRDFAIAHGLLEGDILVFQLIDTCKFQVHITRGSRSMPRVQNDKLVDLGEREAMIEENTCSGNTKMQKYTISRAVDSHWVHNIIRSTEIRGANGNSNLPINDIPRDDNARIVNTGLSAIDSHETVMLTSDQSDQFDDDIHTIAPLGVENSETALNFGDTKGFADFKIHVNGENLDSETPADIRTKYYQLCCVQKAFLHDCVVKDISSKLVVAMILEIVSITDSTNATSLSTPLHDLERMDKSLKSFEDLGMTVESLRAKIGKLIKISSKHHSVAESTRVKLARVESERIALRTKRAKIDELTESAITHGELIGHLEGKLNAFKEKNEKLGLMFSKARRLLE